jgi:hypothetical protein
MYETPIFTAKTYVNDLSGTVVEESQISRLNFRKVDLSATFHLLRSISGDIDIKESQNSLCKSGTVNTER